MDWKLHHGTSIPEGVAPDDYVILRLHAETASHYDESEPLRAGDAYWGPGLAPDGLTGRVAYYAVVGRRQRVTVAETFLARAQELMAQRGKDYDKPSGERSVGRIVGAFNAITGRDLTESEGWMFLLLLKLVRDSTTKDGHADSQDDAVAYSALWAEARRAVR